MKIYKPAIVIVTYNRPMSLQRLLDSIANANYENISDIPFVISIDGGGPQEMLEIAASFEWKFGEKIIIHHTENLGLRKHIISCGDLTQKYDSVIILEDDLFVSPMFYDYSCKALIFYDDNESVAGISLYSYLFNENAYLPFTPLKSSYDVYFKQVPSSCGQAWTKKHWKGFKDFYNLNPLITSLDKLPENVKRWPESSWKKFFYKYIVDNNLFFVYPYLAYSTNFGDIGTHFDYTTTLFQIPIDTYTEKHRTYCFPKNIDESITYDAYFELMPYCFKNNNIFKNRSVCIDLYGQKQLDLFDNDFWISSKQCEYPESQFAATLVPIENNILCNINGNIISYAKKEYFMDKILEKLKTEICSNYSGIIYSNALNLGYVKGYSKGRNSVFKTRVYKVGYYITYPLNLLLSKDKRFKSKRKS